MATKGCHWEFELPQMNKNNGVGEEHLLSRGTRQPAFRGISTSSIERMQYITAEWTTETGELRLPRTSHPVPSKSNTAEPSSSFISTRRQICNFHRRVSNFYRRTFRRSTCRRAIIQIVDRAQDIGMQSLCNLAQKVAHRVLCIVSNMIHVLLNGFQAVILHHCEKSGIVSLRRSRLSREKAYFGVIIEFLCGWQRFARGISQKSMVHKYYPLAYGF